MKYKDESGQWKDLVLPATGDTLPIGSMIPYGNNIAPSNWLICDGSEVSRTTYADLFAVIGTSYGEGDGSTTFNLPNKRGKVSVGLDIDDNDFNEIGKTGGEKTHTLAIAEMPSHQHLFKFTYEIDAPTQKYGTGQLYFGAERNYNTGINSNHTESEGGNAPHNNLQPYEVDCWIIKAFQSAGIIAEIEQNLDSNSEVNAPSVKAVKNAIEKSCILARPTSNYTVENEKQVNIILDNVANKNGDKFSLINNKVKVGKGVSKVKISASVFCNDLIGTGYVWLKVKKKDIDVASSITPKGTDAAPYASASIPTFIMDVVEGDEIGLGVEQTVYTNTTIRSELLETYLFVEEF